MKGGADMLDIEYDNTDLLDQIIGEVVDTWSS